MSTIEINEAYETLILHDGEGLKRPRSWAVLRADQKVYFDLGTLRYNWKGTFGLGTIITKGEKHVIIEPDERVSTPTIISVTALNVIRQLPKGD